MAAATMSPVSGTLATRAGAWARGLPERHGGRLALVALAGIVLLALILRVDPVLHPLEVRPNTDSDIYERIARQLYETGSYAISGSDAAYDWSPGAPIVYAGLYTLLGGADPAYARALTALAVAATAILVYLLGRRLAGTVAGLVGALAVAVYPVTIYYTGKLMSEPLATLALVAAVLTFLWAGDRPRRSWAWAVPGALLGATAFMRPE
jgi:4-amino-4-deoxy-L-arabinose transferase-like glycosyltransferase